jgi:hypothetical protein
MKILQANVAKVKDRGVNPTESLVWSKNIPLESASRIPELARAWAGALGGSQGYRRRCYLGLLLEFAALRALMLLGIRAYYPSSPEAWRRAQGQAADAVLIAAGVQIECKNWGGYKVSPDLVQREVLPRFRGTGAKLLVISTMRGWTEAARRLLDENGIAVLEVGFKISEKNVLEAVAILERRLAAIFGIAVSRNPRKLGYLLNHEGCSRVHLSPRHRGVQDGPARRVLSWLGCVPRAGPGESLVGAGLSAPVATVIFRV